MPDTPRARTRARQAQSPLPKAAARAARRQLERLAKAWSVPSLKAIAVASPRFQAVRVHEAAHAAVCQQHGIGRTRPHGPEWRRLMAAAGHAAERRLDLGRCLAPARTSQSQRNGRPRYDHWCPVCQSLRLAKKPMRQWRCAACVADGLPGRLEITSREPQARRATP